MLSKVFRNFFIILVLGSLALIIIYNLYAYSLSSAIQQNCLDEFIKIHEKNLKDNETNKKLVFMKRNWLGYANKVYAFLTSLTVAILTDSALLIDWPGIDQYIQTPLKDLFRVFEPNSEFNFFYKNATLNFNLPRSTENSFKYEKNLTLMQNTTIPNEKNRLVIEFIIPYFLRFVPIKNTMISLCIIIWFELKLF